MPTISRRAPMNAKKLAARLSRLAFAVAIPLAATLGLAPPLRAQLTESTRAVLATPRAGAAAATRASHAPVIDGRDDEAAWLAATPITRFRVYDPAEDAEPAMRTEARIIYDDRNVYVFVRAFDPHPDSIIALLSRRDLKTPSDQIKVMIDSYHDRRTGYEFAVNPAGVKRDYYTYDDSQEDVSWDAVWNVATRIDSLGWTAEFSIPLSQLRYPSAPSHTFGVMIMRDIARVNERDSWPLLRRSKQGIASQFADVGGFADLPSPRRLEISPYVLTKNTAAVRTDGFARSQQGTMGADVKYGITSNLTLDATVNPDFGQVEADPAQLNLTAFETFLPEQRPFFLEGTGIFQFGDDATRLFYSRRIGRSPQLSGLVSDPLVAVPGASRILGAGKLTGRLSDGTSVGVLGAMTDRTTAGSIAIEPRTTYGVLRATRDFRDGESALGVIGTFVDRSLDTTSRGYLRRGAYVAGVDGRHRFDAGQYALAASLSVSSVRGTAAAITRTQRSPVHEYQRPDDALDVDTLRTTLGGTALGVSAEKVSGVVRGLLQYQSVSPGYESNDLGFLSRADQQTIQTSLRLVNSTPFHGWSNGQVVVYTSHAFSSAGMPNGSTFEMYAFGTRPSGATYQIDSWVDNATPVYCDRCARGGPALRLSPSWSTLVNAAADPKRRVSPSIAAIYTLADQGHSMLWRVRPYVTIRPSSRVGFEIGMRYQRNQDNTQWLANAGVVGADTTHYLFGHLNQDLLSFTSRLDVTLRPTLSLQLYAEPFVTAGHFTDVRELAAPRAAAYEARFRRWAGPTPDGDFNQKSFNTSAVARWEYRPGSTLFIVWTQGRQQEDLDAGSFAARRDYQNLFAARPDNVFLIKASYWIGR
jgi:hypothetical protein